MAAVVSKKTSTWTNNDGLVIFYGTSEGQRTTSGEYNVLGPRHCVELTIDLSTLPVYTTGNWQLQSDTLTIPNGAFVEELEIVVLKETTGSNANLNIGLIDQDRVTEIDYDGLLIAGDDFNGGTDIGKVFVYTKGVTDAGALVGTKIANTGLIVAWADTADFTAGVVKVRIFYSVPLASSL